MLATVVQRHREPSQDVPHQQHVNSAARGLARNRQGDRPGVVEPNDRWVLKGHGRTPAVSAC